MRTRIGLLVQPESMRSIVGATQREQRHGSAGNCLVSRCGAPDGAVRLMRTRIGLLAQL